MRKSGIGNSSNRRYIALLLTLLIAYSLGFVPGLLNIDPDVLDIHFKDNKVVKVGQHRA